MGDVNFSCTMCGKCCRDHNLPLCIDEAIAWIEDGGEVCVLCEAADWSTEPDAQDRRAAYTKGRSFAATCGGSPIRVTVVLIGMVSGNCRNLGDDLRCRIYERRPRVCRIYPAEINPFMVFDARAKSCPPEAWRAAASPSSAGDITDGETRALVEAFRRADREDAPRKRHLCRLLEIDVAAPTGEGFVIHRPESSRLLAALQESRHAQASPPADSGWRIYSTESATVSSLQSRGLEATRHQRKGETFWYVSTAAMRPAASAPQVEEKPHA
ncbi:MAG TPA: YkgJ family cysteine cluster protein [Alphaproteobacteria bacterium]|nr:YkgJ family cysteine cluster protein [Alphaproteobacteria bacterium]